MSDRYAEGLAEAQARVDRLVRRLRHLSPRAWRSGDRAAATRELAQLLADVAQGVEDRATAAQPRWRALPDLPDHVLPDALAVTGNDAVDALRAAGPQTPVWSRTGRTTSGELLDVVLRALGAGDD